MFVRKKKNPSGVVSIQIIDKSSGKYKLVKTVGSSSQVDEIDQLVARAHLEKDRMMGLLALNFEAMSEQELVKMFYNGVEALELKGPELLLGKIFDSIGFNSIKDELFRHLVITRLVYPVSKLKTTDYLYKYKGIEVSVDSIYRYLDKLHKKQIEEVKDIAFNHLKRILGNDLSVVFYDVTTLYFETENADDLRKTGFSKDGKHQHPQIVLGLLASSGGYPIAYEIFEGDITITIDYQKFNKDANWDGLKGYLTNTKLSNEEVLKQYGQLWQIEKTFRISKTDLRIRPIYHFVRRRIESHICIAFAASIIYKELERQLKENKSDLSPEKVIDILKTIYALTITTPYSKTKYSRLLIKTEEQKCILNLFGI